ncbi:MAG: flagellar basal body-associated FliL family protein [Hydrogenophilaceae bacterium]|nr:flagellar basal body-associated FliL family protein [Hydrogenophilaceae bacterium]
MILPAILVLGAGGGAAFFLLKGGGPPAAHAEEGDHGKSKGGGHGGEPGEAVEGAHGVMITPGDGVVYVELPEMLVNIASGDGRPAFLKLKLTLEAADQEIVAALEPEIPRVTDQFNAFLRELRTDDLAGSAGAYRLRLELLRRVNLVIAPQHINAVLIEEMLVQ